MARTDYWQSAWRLLIALGDDAATATTCSKSTIKSARGFHVRPDKSSEVGTGSGGASRGRSQFFLREKSRTVIFISAANQASKLIAAIS
jgi:hypothetical protein